MGIALLVSCTIFATTLKVPSTTIGSKQVLRVLKYLCCHLLDPAVRPLRKVPQHCPLPSSVWSTLTLILGLAFSRNTLPVEQFKCGTGSDSANYSRTLRNDEKYFDPYNGICLTTRLHPGWRRRLHMVGDSVQVCIRARYNHDNSLGDKNPRRSFTDSRCDFMNSNMLIHGPLDVGSPTTAV